MSLDKRWHEVREFQLKFGHPVGAAPKGLNEQRVVARSNWMIEEVEEFRSAKDVYEQADAMIDLIYFAIGTLVELGVKPDKLFDAVHAANMRKLWPDQRPRFAPDGKTIKPEGWVGPERELQQAIQDQLTELIHGGLDE